MKESGKACVVAIDGPSGAGKGTIARRVAMELGFHFLDSGAVYRAAALQCVRSGVDLADDQAAARLIEGLDVSFSEVRSNDDDVTTVERVLLDGTDVSKELRSETTADAASRIASLPGVRKTLLSVQRDFLLPPGLVADGRDMGTVVFPQAQLKIYMTASARVRAERRLRQLNELGIEATLAGLMQEIETRDLRDSTRRHAPLVAAKDARTIDTTGLGIDAAVDLVLDHVRETLGSSITSIADGIAPGVC